MKKILKQKEFKELIKKIIKEQMDKFQMKDGYKTDMKSLSNLLRQSILLTVQNILAKHYHTIDAINMVQGNKIENLKNKIEFFFEDNICIKTLRDKQFY